MLGLNSRKHRKYNLQPRFCPSLLKWSSEVKLRKVELLMTLHLKSYGMSLAIWDYTVLPATRHKWTHPTLKSARSRYSIYLHRRDGRMSWPRWQVTYPDGLPAHRRLPIQVLTQQCTAGVELATCWSQVRRPNHYTSGTEFLRRSENLLRIGIRSIEVVSMEFLKCPWREIRGQKTFRRNFSVTVSRFSRCHSVTPSNSTFQGKQLQQEPWYRRENRTIHE